MKGRRLGLLLGAVAAAVLFYIAYRYFLNRPAGMLEASGTIETTEVDVSFQVTGRVEQRLVDEGDRVRKGQVLAILDEKPLFESAERARALLEGANAAAQQQNAAVSWTRRTLDEQERGAVAALESAQARLREIRTGPRAQEMRQAEAALEAAEASLAKAQLDSDRAAKLVRRGVYSQAALDAASASLVNARGQRDRAREALDLLREGSRKEEIEAAEAQARQAQAQLDQARANRLQVDMREKELATAQAHVAELQASLNIARISLDYARLTAPIDGWVLLKSIEAGEVVNVGTPVLTLGDIEDLWMNVYVGETAVGRLRLGDTAEVRVDAHENDRFEGKIVFISQEAEFTPKNVQTREERTKLVFRIKVAIRNREQKLKPGMPADAYLSLR